MISKTVNIVINDNEIGAFRELGFNVAKLEGMISELSYSGERLPKDRSVEKSKIPYFVVPFYDFVFQNDRIPTEKELINDYITRFYSIETDGCIKILEEFDRFGFTKSSLPLSGVIARLLRSYPSILRDIHFLMLCSTSNYFDNVIYDLKVDILEGYDLMIEKGDHQFFVKLYLDSVRSVNFEKAKHKRHKFDANRSNVINLKASLNKNNAFGSIYLYTGQLLCELESEIKNRLNKINI